LNRRKILNLTLIIIIILIPLLIANRIPNNNQDNEKKKNLQEKNLVEKNPKPTGFWTESFIHVNYNWSKTNSSNLWCNGKGTKAEPYIIENVTVDRNGNGICILIENMREYFELRNCTVTDAEVGIKIVNATNINISNTKIYDINGKTTPSGANPSNHIGISLSNCSNIFIWSNNLSQITGGNGENNNGNGGHGDSAVGIYINNSKNAIISTNNISSINGGDGGYGMDAASGYPDGKDGFNGGIGGDALGLFSENSDNITFAYNNISNILGGNGGYAGNASDGVDRSVPFADGGNGGNGGHGGHGGSGFGIYLKSLKNNSNLNNQIFKIQSGSGGDGGNGGEGGHGGAGSSNPPMLGSNGGEGGDGGDGGNGGLNAGIYCFGSINITNILNSIKNIISGGAGAKGIKGLGGAGGSYGGEDGPDGEDGEDGTSYNPNGFDLENTNGSLSYLNSISCQYSTDNGMDNKWDNETLGNYWSEYQGIDENPIDGIGDIYYTLDAVSKANDTKPLMFSLILPSDMDYDNDGLTNIEEFIPGEDGYITNSSNSDTDDDGLSDYWEFYNQTTPLNNDTDDDSFIDGLEIGLNTDPRNIWWYPMPNLIVADFKNIITYENQSYLLDFSIQNNGIWKAEGVAIIIRCQSENLILYNNTNTPIDIDVDEIVNIKETYSKFNETGDYTLELIIDQLNTVNETYCNKDGSINVNGENDNSQVASLTILSEYQPGQTTVIKSDDADGDDDDSYFNETMLIATFSVIAAYSIVSTIGIAVLLKRLKSMKKLAKIPKKKSIGKSY